LVESIETLATLLHIEIFYGTIIIMSRKEIKEKVINLRREGRTYSEILKFLKSTTLGQAHRV
jgi:alkyl hydroperoxide reductase subunit AhpC